jgi:AcrR family transcriptional regulator
MKGDRTRAAILDHAVNLASLEGLQGLTIGRLAEDLEMSKSGLFAHFGSKEELQLATIEAAGQRFIDEAFRPALAAPRGYPRLLALCRSWLDYLKRSVFPGGCFFAAASFEFDGRSGPVRDLIESMMNDWISAIEKAVRMAKDEGHIDPNVDPSQVAFEMNALFFGANFAYNLRHDKRALDRARIAIEQRLEGLRVKRARRTPQARSARPRSARAPRRA